MVMGSIYENDKNNENKLKGSLMEEDALKGKLEEDPDEVNVFKIEEFDN